MGESRIVPGAVQFLTHGPGLCIREVVLSVSKTEALNFYLQSSNHFSPSAAFNR